MSAMPCAVDSLVPPPENIAKRYEFSHPQMGTVFKLIFYAANERTATQAAQAVFARVDTLNAIMSDYLPESELNRLCAKAGNGEKVRVSPDLWQILVLSKRFSTHTQGAFDVTVGPITRLWRRARNLKEVPDSTRVAEASNLVGFEKMKFYRRKHQVRLTQKGMKLDLGGIAQGYAADDCLKILRQYGITQALADAGGDIALGDAPPAAKGWKIDIPPAFRALMTENTQDSCLWMTNCGITVSGAKFRYLEANGKRYSHIVNPKTGWALQYDISVMVMAPSGVVADALATAISVMPPCSKPELQHSFPQVKYWRSTLGIACD